MDYQPHEQRVIDERRELSEKFSKLNDFLLTEVFASLELADRELLWKQFDIMHDYISVLNRRIDRFGKKD